MDPLNSLKVIEIMHASKVYLGTDEKTRGLEVLCKMHSIDRPRELDDYHLSGVYNKAGVPVQIDEIGFNAETVPIGNKAYQAYTKQISDSVYEGITKDKGVFVTGGTCLHAPGVAGGIRRAFSETAKLGVIWLDAHGDINIPETSPSGMVGGMPFAVMLGYCMQDWCNICGLNPPFDDRFALLCDARSFDKEEADNLRNMSLKVLNTDEFLDEFNWAKKVNALAKEVDALYLHIDADIVDSKYVPDHNTPEPNGPDIWSLLRNIRIVMETGKVPVVTLASIYFDADSLGKERSIGPETSILTGIRMIAAILENWKNKPNPHR
ncbi:MAG: arginase family protein [Defluviitaleaceae bacterium]|nr:arginase family protein [Defluviitaleaceae bacterium]